MRSLALMLATVVGLGGCVYDPYYGYAYYPRGPVVAAPVVTGTLVFTDPDVWPYHSGGYHYRYPYSAPWHGRYHPYRGRYWHP